MYVAYAEYKRKPILITSNSSETIYHLFASASIPGLDILKIGRSTIETVRSYTEKYNVKVLDLYPIKMTFL